MIQQTTGGLLEMLTGKVFVVSICSFLYKAVHIPYIICYYNEHNCMHVWIYQVMTRRSLMGNSFLFLARSESDFDSTVLVYGETIISSMVTKLDY